MRQDNTRRDRLATVFSASKDRVFGRLKMYYFSPLPSRVPNLRCVYARHRDPKFLVGEALGIRPGRHFRPRTAGLTYLGGILAFHVGTANIDAVVGRSLP